MINRSLAVLVVLALLAKAALFTCVSPVFRGAGRLGVGVSACLCLRLDWRQDARRPKKKRERRAWWRSCSGNYPKRMRA
jgi:hypothetical protein